MSFDCGVAGEFAGALQAISRIVQREGVRGLFAGYGSFLLRDLPFDAIEFVAYEQLKKSYQILLSDKRDIHSLEVSAIGECL
jgi:solute carrier family 25 S-adenosylmethionine transporter 26